MIIGIISYEPLRMERNPNRCVHRLGGSEELDTEWEMVCLFPAKYPRSLSTEVQKQIVDKDYPICAQEFCPLIDKINLEYMSFHFVPLQKRI